mmetsp:Transcript_81266/g.230229  ORF Transcript_81266/g.230229 Transcript_81266/m.230229 type:complete len:208 (+) Transcript_81266:18-641(+)
MGTVNGVPCCTQATREKIVKCRREACSADVPLVSTRGGTGAMTADATPVANESGSSDSPPIGVQPVLHEGEGLGQFPEEEWMDNDPVIPPSCSTNSADIGASPPDPAKRVVWGESVANTYEIAGSKPDRGKVAKLLKFDIGVSGQAQRRRNRRLPTPFIRAADVPPARDDESDGGMRSPIAVVAGKARHALARLSEARGSERGHLVG